MDNTTNAESSALPLADGKGLTSTMRNFMQLMYARHQRMCDALHVHELPDYLLRDIGLERRHIDRVIKAGSPRGGV